MKYLYAYRNIWIPAGLVTITACVEAWRNDSITVIFIFGWVKVITTALLIVYIHLFRDHLVFFFMNLGIGRLKFYASMFTIDMTIYFALITLILISR